MQLLKSLKAFVGYGRCTYMEIILKEIELANQLFQLEVLNKHYATIPPQLIQSHLPLSYQFYDSIIHVAQTQQDEQLLNQQRLKFKLNIQRVEDDLNFKNKLYEMTGLHRYLQKVEETTPVYQYKTVAELNAKNCSYNLVAL